MNMMEGFKLYPHQAISEGNLYGFVAIGQMLARDVERRSAFEEIRKLVQDEIGGVLKERIAIADKWFRSAQRKNAEYLMREVRQHRDELRQYPLNVFDLMINCLPPAVQSQVIAPIAFVHEGHYKALIDDFVRVNMCYASRGVERLHQYIGMSLFPEVFRDAIETVKAKNMYSAIFTIGQPTTQEYRDFKTESVEGLKAEGFIQRNKVETVIANAEIWAAVLVEYDMQQSNS